MLTWRARPKAPREACLLAERVVLAVSLWSSGCMRVSRQRAAVRVDRPTRLRSTRQAGPGDPGNAGPVGTASQQALLLSPSLNLSLSLALSLSFFSLSLPLSSSSSLADPPPPPPPSVDAPRGRGEQPGHRPRQTRRGAGSFLGTEARRQSSGKGALSESTGALSESTGALSESTGALSESTYPSRRAPYPSRRAPVSVFVSLS